jgi:hypothetical protein
LKSKLQPGKGASKRINAHRLRRLARFANRAFERPAMAHALQMVADSGSGFAGINKVGDGEFAFF